MQKNLLSWPYTKKSLYLFWLSPIIWLFIWPDELSLYIYQYPFIINITLAIICFFLSVFFYLRLKKKRLALTALYYETSFLAYIIFLASICCYSLSAYSNYDLALNISSFSLFIIIILGFIISTITYKQIFKLNFHLYESDKFDFNKMNYTLRASDSSNWIKPIVLNIKSGKIKRAKVLNFLGTGTTIIFTICIGGPVHTERDEASYFFKLIFADNHWLQLFATNYALFIGLILFVMVTLIPTLCLKLQQLHFVKESEKKAGYPMQIDE